MKKTWKLIVSIACVAAMVLSLGAGAFAMDIPKGVSDEDIYTMARRALDAQEIQNVMTWHVMYHCWGEHMAELENIWVQEYENRATASFGQNQGFMVGYDSILEAYGENHDASWLESAKKYCDVQGIDIEGWTDEEILEVYGGVGQLLLHVTTTACIEVAGDGQTAKAYWYSPGMICESGQTGNTIWEAYGADFVKENGVWKLWHLHMFTDFMGGFYITLGGKTNGNWSVPGGGSSGEASDEADDSEQGEWHGYGGSQMSTKHEYLYAQQYYEFSHDRLREDMEIFIPLPYDTWSFDDPNYGLTREQYESYGIDLDAWYAAHETDANVGVDVVEKDGESFVKLGDLLELLGL